MVLTKRNPNLFSTSRYSLGLILARTGRKERGTVGRFEKNVLKPVITWIIGIRFNVNYIFFTFLTR